MNVEWEAHHILESKFGELDLNYTDVDSMLRYQVLPDGFMFGPTLRVVQQALSQMSGSVLHPRFRTGASAVMSVQYQQMDTTEYGDPVVGGEYELPCGADRISMDDQLTMWLNSLKDLTYADNQRLKWVGSDGVTRMLVRIELLAFITRSFSEGLVTVSFAVESELPHALSFTQKTDGGAPATYDIENDGTDDTWPVFKVHASGAPIDAFSIINNTTGLRIDYDSSRPGAVPVPDGHYVEIDCFKGTAIKDGNDADYIAAIAPGTSDFFTIDALGVGNPNSIEYDCSDGGTMDVLWNDAWA